MAKKEIRTKYIKGLIADKESLTKTLEESTKESLSAILDESVNRSIREMLSESDDSYSEEDVNPDNEISFDGNSEDNGGEPAENDGANMDQPEGDNQDGDNPEGGAEGETDGDEVWKNAEQWKDEDGEYDMRGKDIEDVLELVKNMDINSDGLRIIKTSDNTATVVPEDGEEEFEINISDGGNTEDMPNEFEHDGQGSMEDNLDGNDGLDNPGEGSEGSSEEGMMDDIDLNSLEGENGAEDDGEGTNFEIEFGDDNEQNNNEDMVNEGNVNLGYTDNYQKKTAMTMPHDKGEGEGDSRFDQGAPTGDGKRWVGNKGANGGNPYTEKTKQPMTEECEECNGASCGEEAIFEVELGDDMPEVGGDDAAMMEGASTITRNNAYVNSTGRNQIHSPEQDDKVRNGHREASQKRGTGDGRGTMNEAKRMAAINRQANAVLNENKELREIASEIKTKLNEAVIINSSLAKVIKLITENTTTRDEKINILNRFDKVKSLNEADTLYRTISDELNGKVRRNTANLIGNQISEARNNNNNMIVETNMLNVSSEIQGVLDFQDRLSKIK